MPGFAVTFTDCDKTHEFTLERFRHGQQDENRQRCIGATMRMTANPTTMATRSGRDDPGVMRASERQMAQFRPMSSVRSLWFDDNEIGDENRRGAGERPIMR